MIICYDVPVKHRINCPMMVKKHLSAKKIAEDNYLSFIVDFQLELTQFGGQFLLKFDPCEDGISKICHGSGVIISLRAA